jgi:O-antigen/teichoic acid export membrane protein
LAGTAGSQAIGLLILPILARVFAPEAFGIFQLYLSLLIFCTIGIALRMELVLLSGREDEADTTTGALLRIVIVVAASLYLASELYALFGPGLGFPSIYLGLGLIGNGFIQVVSCRLVRQQSFSRLASLKFSQVLVYAIVALAIAAMRPTLLGLITADVAGRLAAGALAFLAVRDGRPRAAAAIGFRGLPRFVRKHSELALISMPGALVNSAGAMLTPFMIFHVFGAAAAGQYGLVDRMVGVPIAMLVTAGSQVFTGALAEHIGEGDLGQAWRLWSRTVTVGIGLGGLGAIAGWFAIPFAFDLLFGPEWAQAADIARIMIFSYSVAFATGIVNQTLVSLRAFRMQSALDFAWLVGIGAAWVAVVMFDLGLFAAVVLYAAIVSAQKLAFVALCVIGLRRASRSVQGQVQTENSSELRDGGGRDVMTNRWSRDFGQGG